MTLERPADSSNFNRRYATGAIRALLPGVETLVITQIFRDSRLLLFALEGRRILAGGETTGSRRPILRAPAGARDVNEFDEIVQDRATVPRPCRGAKAIMTGFPVVSPPANLRCASGAKLKRFG